MRDPEVGRGRDSELNPEQCSTVPGPGPEERRGVWAIFLLICFHAR